MRTGPTEEQHVRAYRAMNLSLRTTLLHRRVQPSPMVGFTHYTRDNRINYLDESY